MQCIIAKCFENQSFIFQIWHIHFFIYFYVWTLSFLSVKWKAKLIFTLVYLSLRMKRVIPIGKRTCNLAKRSLEWNLIRRNRVSRQISRRAGTSTREHHQEFPGGVEESCSENVATINPAFRRRISAGTSGAARYRALSPLLLNRTT